MAQTRKRWLLATAAALLLLMLLAALKDQEVESGLRTSAEEDIEATPRVHPKAERTSQDTGTPLEFTEADVKNALFDGLNSQVEARLDAQVRCPIAGVPPHTDGSFVSGLLRTPVSVLASGDLILREDAPEGDGLLILSGFEQTPLTWTRDPLSGLRTCQLGPLLPAEVFTLSGQVLAHDGSPAAQAKVRGCDLFLTSDEQGSFEAARVHTRPCTLHAYGGEMGDSLAEAFVPEATEDIELELRAEELAMMGIIAWSRPAQDYWEVPEVLPGSPAAGAGMVAGDEITSVDGQEVAGHIPGELLPGPVGRSIELGFSDGTTAQLKLEPADQVYRDAGFSEEDIVGMLQSRSMGWSY